MGNESVWRTPQCWKGNTFRAAFWRFVVKSREENFVEDAQKNNERSGLQENSDQMTKILMIS